MHERMEYMLDMSNTIRCDWFFATEEALLKVDETGMVDLCDLAKVGIMSSVNTEHVFANPVRPRCEICRAGLSGLLCGSM